MADKVDHNYNAGVAAGRRLFARELQMFMEARANQQAEELLSLVAAEINDEVLGNPSPPR